MIDGKGRVETMNTPAPKPALKSVVGRGPVVVALLGAVLVAPLMLAALIFVLLAGVVSASLGGGVDEGPVPAAAAVGSVTAQGWTHPMPGMVTYQGNYGQLRAGYVHAGEDLSAPAGTPIYAAAAGVVSRASCQGFQGRSPCNIIINHGADETGQVIETWYVHMYQLGVLVSVGQQVSAGEQIALTGSNGNSTGPHLHLEVHLDGVVTDPTAFFTARGVDLRDPSLGPTINAAATQALTWARTQIGKPYVWGATGPDSYDCSGLTSRAYQNAALQLPRTSREQYAATTRITEFELAPGDLIFWSADGTAQGIYHVALYAGNGLIVQAPSAGKDVEEVNLWRENLFAFGRLS